ncbi:hypothetical protein COPG_00012 [Colwellia phage 9A]|uniref:Uncharacterized protein n=1 Tax=Colwellia phage 9A TaxID=765765 RepID=I3UM93_9CAUD|nr:hypothetical protein COPG_00012 [Colwellia phage 9A]AFK66608.1 hypothetical protein COPG_00012 [Colwellia phage 9A]
MIKRITAYIAYKWLTRNSKEYYIHSTVTSINGASVTNHMFVVTYQYGKFKPATLLRKVVDMVGDKHLEATSKIVRDSQISVTSINLLK